MPIIQLLWTLIHPCEWKMATLEDILGMIKNYNYICSNPQDVKFDTKLGLPFDEPYEVQTPSDTLSILLTTSNEQRDFVADIELQAQSSMSRGDAIKKLLDPKVMCSTT